jgi:hypothetical protein
MTMSYSQMMCDVASRAIYIGVEKELEGCEERDWMRMALKCIDIRNMTIAIFTIA